MAEKLNFQSLIDKCLIFEGKIEVRKSMLDYVLFDTTSKTNIAKGNNHYINGWIDCLIKMNQ